MQCPKCGVMIPDDSAFCQFCGVNIQQYLDEEKAAKEVAKKAAAILNENKMVQEQISTVPLYHSVNNSPKIAQKTSKIPIVTIVLLSILLAASVGMNIYQYSSMQDNAERITSLERDLNSSKSSASSLKKQLSDAQNKGSEYDEICNFLRRSDVGFASNNFKCSQGVVLLEWGGGEKEVTLTTGFATTYTYTYYGWSATGHFKYNNWEGNTTKFIFTPTLIKGLTRFEFTNDANNQSFSVLVIVD